MPPSCAVRRMGFSSYRYGKFAIPPFFRLARQLRNERPEGYGKFPIVGSSHLLKKAEIRPGTGDAQGKCEPQESLDESTMETLLRWPWRRAGRKPMKGPE